MKESAQTALTYVRSVCPEYGIDDDYFEKHDLHIHIPESGAEGRTFCWNHHGHSHAVRGDR